MLRTVRLALSGATKCAVNGYTFCRLQVTTCAGATKCAVTGGSRNNQQVNVRSMDQYKLVGLNLFVQETNLYSIIFLTYDFLDTSFLLPSSFQLIIARRLAGEKFFCC